jgi:hypothetical protein
MVTCCCWVNNVMHIMHHTPMFVRLQCPEVLAGRYNQLSISLLQLSRPFFTFGIIRVKDSSTHKLIRQQSHGSSCRIWSEIQLQISHSTSHIEFSSSSSSSSSLQNLTQFHILKNHSEFLRYSKYRDLRNTQT